MTEGIKPLVRQFGESDPKTLADLWMILARNVEDSMIEAGATTKLRRIIEIFPARTGSTKQL